jgi:predicted RNase H-like HicB family nuclease
MTYKYLVVVEKTGSGFSAYSPDVPGCVAAAKSVEAVETAIREAIEFHLEGLAEMGEEIPQPQSRHMFAVFKNSEFEKSSYHVLPGDGQWVVKKSGAARATRVYPKKELAVQYGRELAQKHAAELVIHNRDGRVTSVKRNSKGELYKVSGKLKTSSSSKTSRK